MAANLHLHPLTDLDVPQSLWQSTPLLGKLRALVDLVGAIKDDGAGPTDGRGFASDLTDRWVKQMDTVLDLNITFYWGAGSIHKHKCL